MIERGWAPKKDPWLPGDYDPAVIWAVRAFAKGEATQGQQVLLWQHLHYLGGVGDQWADLPYRPGATGDRDTVFACGKMWPVLQWRKMLRPELTPQGPDPETMRKRSENPALPARAKKPKRGKKRR